MPIDTPEARRAAAEVGLPLRAAFALLQMESGGENVFGHDAGGMFKGEPVTKAKYDRMVAAVANGKPSNGVGPLQITWRGFFPDAARRGLELWKPYDNMVYGFGLAADYWRRYGNWSDVGRRYNGKASYGTTFARRVEEWKTRLGDDDMAWYLAPALVQLRNELDARWPKRDRTSDGSIGDTAHASRASEHNPEPDGRYKGRVNALDIDKDGVDTDALLKILKSDPRVWYFIFERRIYSRTYDFASRAYTGSNPHDKHIHVSVYPTQAAGESAASWGIDDSRSVPKPPAPKPTPKPAPKPAPKPKYVALNKAVTPGGTHAQVAVLQQLLIDAGYGPIRGAVTKFYGENTRAAVARFHRKNPDLSGASPDPAIGPKGFRRLQEQARAKKG